MFIKDLIKSLDGKFADILYFKNTGKLTSEKLDKDAVTIIYDYVNINKKEVSYYDLIDFAKYQDRKKKNNVWDGFEWENIYCKDDLILCVVVQSY